jgi:proteic killer suppression protein
MILRFRHKGLESLFRNGDPSGLSSRDVGRLRRILFMLNNSRSPIEMNLPGFRLHPLKVDRKGQWAVRVSGNWRVVFEFAGENATNLDLVDYH